MLPQTTVLASLNILWDYWLRHIRYALFILAIIVHFWLIHIPLLANLQTICLGPRIILIKASNYNLVRQYFNKLPTTLVLFCWSLILVTWQRMISVQNRTLFCLDFWDTLEVFWAPGVGVSLWYKSVVVGDCNPYTQIRGGCCWAIKLGF